MRVIRQRSGWSGGQQRGGSRQPNLAPPTTTGSARAMAIFAVPPDGGRSGDVVLELFPPSHTSLYDCDSHHLDQKAHTAQHQCAMTLNPVNSSLVGPQVDPVTQAPTSSEVSTPARPRNLRFTGILTAEKVSLCRSQRQVKSKATDTACCALLSITRSTRCALALAPSLYAPAS